MKKNDKIDVSYYENNDLSDMMRKADSKKKVYKVKTKRITMNITNDAYETAHDLDRFMGMGYQNVLKTAIVLGLKDLQAIINKDKKKNKSA